MILFLIVLCLVPSSVVSQFGTGNRNVPNISATTFPNNERHRIIGGVETERNEYPFIVGLSKYGHHFCGGSIIGPSWVLSAAHCVSNPGFNVTAGEHDIRIPEGTEQVVKAVKVIRHPNYNPVTYEDDIALVKVHPPFTFTEYVQSFKLPSVHFIATGNVTTAGWGVIEEGSHEVSPVLRKVTIGLFPNMDCVKQYGRDYHSQKMICAGEAEGGKDACQGDSGGPLLCSGYNNRAILCGVVSFGFGCARANFAGVYTKVAFYSDWIKWEQGKDSNPDTPYVWTTSKPLETNPLPAWGVDFNKTQIGRTEKPTTANPHEYRGKDPFTNAGSSPSQLLNSYLLLSIFSCLYLTVNSFVDHGIRRN